MTKCPIVITEKNYYGKWVGYSIKLWFGVLLGRDYRSLIKHLETHHVIAFLNKSIQAVEPPWYNLNTQFFGWKSEKPARCLVRERQKKMLPL